MNLSFLDTNIFLRHLRQDDSQLSPLATSIFNRIEQQKLKVCTSDIVIFEAVFTLQRTYKITRNNIAEALLPLIELPGIKLPGKSLYRKVFNLYCTSPLGFADCYHLVLMQKLGIDEILSFDTDFDNIPGIKRKKT